MNSIVDQNYKDEFKNFVNQNFTHTGINGWESHDESMCGSILCVKGMVSKCITPFYEFSPIFEITTLLENGDMLEDEIDLNLTGNLETDFVTWLNEVKTHLSNN